MDPRLSKALTPEVEAMLVKYFGSLDETNEEEVCILIIWRVSVASTIYIGLTICQSIIKHPYNKVTGFWCMWLFLFMKYFTYNYLRLQLK